METEVQKAVWPRWSGYLSESDQQCGSSDPEHIKGAGQTRRRGSAGPAGAIPAGLLAVLTPASWGGPPPRLHLAFLSSSFGSPLFSGFSWWLPTGLWLSPTSSSQHTQHILEPCLIHPSAQNTLPTISPKQTLPASFYVFQQVPSPPKGEGAEGPFSNFPRTLCLSLQLAETLITLQNGQLLLVGHWGKWGGVGGGTCLALPSIPRLGPSPGFLVTALEVTQVFPTEADLGWWPRSGVLCGPRESPGWGTRERAQWGSGPAHF